ncbi:MAG: PAS domain S-box protein [Verrucomicrobiales bacterium]|nr:PAS domain S-box protein [Verrucomicrobiales bacterium]
MFLRPTTVKKSSPRLTQLLNSVSEFEGLAELAALACGASSAGIVLREDDDFVLMTGCGAEPLLWRGAPGIEESILEKVIETGEMHSCALPRTKSAELARGLEQFWGMPFGGSKKPGGVVFILGSNTAGEPPIRCESLEKVARQVEALIERCNPQSFSGEPPKVSGSRFNSSIEGIMTLDEMGKVSRSNETGLKFLEIDSMPEDATIDFIEMVTVNYRESVSGMLNLALSGDEGIAEYLFEGSRGGRIWLETLFAPLRNNNDEVEGVSAIHRDITESKKREEELILLTSGLEHSLSGFDIVNEAGKMVYANRAYLDLWGYESADEVVGHSPVSHCQDPGVPERIIGTLKKEGTCRIEFTALRKDGSTFEALMSARLIPGANGSEIYAGSTVDITERKKMEEEIRLSREHLADLVNSVDGIVWEADPTTFRFTFVNSRAETILGYPAAQWIEEPTFRVDHMHPDDREYAVHYGRELIGGKKDFELTYRMIAADGRTVWLRDLVKVGVENDDVTSLRGIMVDVTEQHYAELRIRQLNRTHSILSGINQLIVREKDPEALLSKACQLAVENGLFEMAWIGLVNQETGSLELTGHAGAGDAELKLLKSMLGDDASPPACCFTERSLSLGNHEICNDVATDPEARPWREIALESGYHSIASLPLLEGDRIVGNFNLYSGEAGFFDESEMELLDKLAEDISFALTVHKQEERRLAVEQELRTSETKLSESMRFARLTHWEFDLENQCFQFDDNLYRLLHVSAEDIGGYEISPGPLFEKFCFPEEIPHLTKSIEQMITRNDASSTIFENRVKLGNGGVGWFSTEVFSERDAEGWPLRVHGITQEITQRRKAENAVQEVEHRFRRLIEHSADCIVLTDNEHRIQYASPSVFQIENAEPEALMGQSILENVHPDDTESLAGSLSTLTDNPASTVELFWRRCDPDGGWLWLEGVATNLLEDPCIEAIVINYRDVTARKQLEENFRQSQKLEAIGQLAGGVAHDFNNILTIIGGYGSVMMAAEGLSPEIENASREIVQASERGAGLTKQLLAFSRRQVLQTQQLDLNENVTSMTNMLQRILGEDIRLVIDLHEKALTTRADAGMIDQLLMNLVVNSRDAMPDGGTLTIETQACCLGDERGKYFPDAMPGNYVQIRVSDSGEGIPPEYIDRIFDPFFTTKEQGKGTGLGLATVFGIVKQHAGFLSVESEPGKGTSFLILLPACEPHLNLRDISAVEPAIKTGSETILLVEDEEPVRNLGRHVLERAGYTVVEASDGVSAMKAWEENRENIDLLFSDIVMPGGLSGLDLAANLQELDPDLSVIFISGYSADIAGRELKLQEGQNFIQKPCSPRNMLKIVRKVLDEKVSHLYS